MKEKEYWQDFQKLVRGRPNYRVWLHCEDPEEKNLRSEISRLLNRLNSCASQVNQLPMPTEMTDAHFTRASLHIDQHVAFYNFMETLFENFLHNKEDKNMDLLFSFLDLYARLLEREIAWAQQ